MICYTETNQSMASPTITDCDYGRLAVVTDDVEVVLELMWDNLTEEIVDIHGVRFDSGRHRAKAVDYLQQLIANFKRDYPHKVLQTQILDSDFHSEEVAGEMRLLFKDAGFVTHENISYGNVVMRAGASVQQEGCDHDEL